MSLSQAYSFVRRACGVDFRFAGNTHADELSGRPVSRPEGTTGPEGFSELFAQSACVQLIVLVPRCSALKRGFAGQVGFLIGTFFFIYFIFYYCFVAVTQISSFF